MRDDAYIFVEDGKVGTLLSMKPEPPKRGARSSITKESLQACHVYDSSTNRNRARGRAL